MLSEVRAFLQPWYMKLGVITLSGAVGVGAYNWICWSGLSASDWGTWTGAIGTVATLIGTIYLASSETRRLKKYAQTVAGLHGASMGIRVSNVHIAVLEVSLKIEVGYRLNQQADFLRELHIKLSSIDLWTIDELVPLVPLPNNVAVKLVEAAENVKMSAISIYRLEQRARAHVTSEEDALTFTAIKATLRAAVRALDEAGKQCRMCGLHLQLEGR